MSKITRRVDMQNLVRELAHNKVDALELLREALSNARDHDARRVWVRTQRGRAPSDGTDLLVINDGEGMTREQIQAFWGVSSSVKSKPSSAIGYKGHGSKLFFSCRRLSVATCDALGTPWMLSTLENPLRSNETEVDEGPLPPAHRIASELKTVDLAAGPGVAILVEGCSFDDHTRFLNRQEIESYCDWFTVIGDVRSGVFGTREEFHKFVQNPSDMTALRIHEQPMVVLDVFLQINGEPKYQPLGASSSKPASEHLTPWAKDRDFWLKSGHPGMAAFGHRFADVFESDGGSAARRVKDDRTALCLIRLEEFSANPDYGVVLRVEGQRRQLDWYYEGSRQPRGGLYEFDQRFGLWLCKDFIPIVQRNDLLVRALERATEKSKKKLRFDLSKTRYWQVFVNHQQFQLTANRNNITNTNHHDEKIIELVAAKIAESLIDDAFREWIENLQRAVTASKRSRELESMARRHDAVTAWFKKPSKSDLEPTNLAGLDRIEDDDSLRLPEPKNEQELFYLYALLSGRYKLPLRVIEYDASRAIDAVAQVQEPSLFSPQMAIARLEFKHTVRANVSIQHFFDAIDAIVCWHVASTGTLPEAGESPIAGALRKRGKPRLRSKMDSHEIEYTTAQEKLRVIPVLSVSRLFSRT